MKTAESAVSPDHELICELEAMARNIRVETLKAIAFAKSGHPGGSLSAADIMAALYFWRLRIDPSRPDWPDRDRFIMSKGHAAPVLYTTLALRGYFPKEELRSLRQLDSRLQGHPDMRKTPGVDMTSGSLGQGLSVGLGMVLAARALGSPARAYVMLGDGEVQEGQVWEAAMAAAHYKASGLVAIVDNNNVQLDGTVPQVMEIAPLAEKWRTFGWQVREFDGHAMPAIVRALTELDDLLPAGPVALIAHTVKGKGVSYMEGKAEWHGLAPSQEQLAEALRELERV